MLEHPSTLERNAKDFSRHACFLLWRADMGSQASQLSGHEFPASCHCLAVWLDGSSRGCGTEALSCSHWFHRTTPNEPRILLTCMKQDSDGFNQTGEKLKLPDGGIFPRSHWYKGVEGTWVLRQTPLNSIPLGSWHFWTWISSHF